MRTCLEQAKQLLGNAKRLGWKVPPAVVAKILDKAAETEGKISSMSKK